MVLSDFLIEMMKPFNHASSVNALEFPGHVSECMLLRFLRSSSNTKRDKDGPEGTVGQLLLSVLGHLLRGEYGDGSKRVACQLVARLLSLHYGELVFLDLDHIMQTKVIGAALSSPDCAGKSVGDVLCESLLSQVRSSGMDSSDPVYVESLRLSLQCLLGRCNFAKTLALSVGFVDRLVIWAESLVSKVKHDLNVIGGYFN